MTRRKLFNGRYSYAEVVLTYMGSINVRVLDEVVLMNSKVDKQSEAVYSQLIAEAWGIA